MDKIRVPNRPFGPFPTALVGADVDGRPNYTTVGACGVVSLEPVLYVSLKDTHYSTAGIQANGYFSVNIPSAEMAQKADYCGVVSGKEVDKAALFTTFYDNLGKAPMIQECPVNYLCRVIQTLPIFGFEMFFGEIIAVHVSNDCLTDGKPDPEKVNPLIMMYPGYYGLGQTVGAVFKEGAAYKRSLESVR